MIFVVLRERREERVGRSFREKEGGAAIAYEICCIDLGLRMTCVYIGVIDVLWRKRKTVRDICVRQVRQNGIGTVGAHRTIRRSRSVVLRGLTIQKLLFLKKLEESEKPYFGDIQLLKILLSMCTDLDDRSRFDLRRDEKKRRHTQLAIFFQSLPYFSKPFRKISCSSLLHRPEDRKVREQRNSKYLDFPFLT